MERKSANEMQWKSLKDGVSFSPLRMTKPGAGSFLIRMKAGSRSDAHMHPAGEELYVIEGSGKLDDLNFQTGDFVYTPPTESHTVYADTDLTLLVYLPEPVVSLE